MQKKSNEENSIFGARFNKDQQSTSRNQRSGAMGGVAGYSLLDTFGLSAMDFDGADEVNHVTCKNYQKDVGMKDMIKVKSHFKTPTTAHEAISFYKSQHLNQGDTQSLYNNCYEN